MNKQEILDSLSEIKPTLQRQGIELIGLFGSYARDEANEQSDIDILIETTESFVQNTDPLKAFTILSNFKMQIEKRLHKKIDLVDKAGLNEIGKQFILKEVLHV
jgi:predicted nucleotidyltransferase